jgi:hypothetical protein
VSVTSSSGSGGGTCTASAPTTTGAVRGDAKGAGLARHFRRGDRVEWNFGRGKAVGTVQRKLTSPVVLGTQRVAASEADPRYVVKTESGKVAAHRPQALRRRRAR